MAFVNFKKGLRSNLPATFSAGTFYVTTDERAIYLDVDDSSRIRLGDFQEFATVEALEANPNPSTTALYYVSGINCLAKWNGSEYIQINRDTGMTSVEVTGEGNAVTAAVYSADGRKLTLTKGATYMTAADVDGKIDAKVGAIEGTVKAYVDEKTTGIASSANLEALAGRVTTAETDIDAIEKSLATGGATANAIAAAQKAGDDAQADVDALGLKVGTVAEGKTVVGLIEEAQTQANKGVTDAATAQAKADEAFTLAGQKATMEQVNAAISGAGHAVKSEVETALGNMETAYKAADEALETKLQGNIDKKVDQTAYDTKVAAIEGTISAEETRAKGVEEGLETRLKAVEDDHLTSADKEALQTQINTIMNNPDTEGVINSITEFTQYVEEHGEIAEGFRTDINANAEAIADLEGIVGKEAVGEEPATGLVKDVADNAAAIAAEKARAEGIEAGLAQADIDNLAAAKKYTDDEIAELNIAQYAKQTALDAHTGDAVAHITAAERTAWNAAEQNAKTYADGLKTAVETAFAAADTALKTELTTEIGKKADQTALDGAVGRIGTAEGKITALEEASAKHALKTEVEAVQTALDEYEEANDAVVAGKADKATTLAGYGITDAMTKSDIEAMMTWGTF